MNRGRTINAPIFNVDANLNDMLIIHEEFATKYTGSEETKNSRGIKTREQMQSSWKCEPVSLTEEELREMPKNVKFFEPSAGVNFEGPCLVRGNNVFQNK